MAVSFGGLATGLDTKSIIDALMKVEQQPIDRLNNDKSFYQNRLKAFTDFNSKLTALKAAADAIDTEQELNTPTATASSDEYFSATASSSASMGSYQITVVDLAQVQKDVSDGVADSAAKNFGTGNLTLTVNGTATDIAISSSNNSLSGIVSAINDANLGVTATMINDGTDTPYRMVLTGDGVDDSFSLDSSGLSGGTYANPTMTNKQTAHQAHIQVDGIDIYSDSNTFQEAIQGVTLNVLKKDDTATTTLTLNSDPDSTTTKIKNFVTAYNGVVSYIASQSDADWGNDSTFTAIKRQMQSLLTSTVSTSGSYSTLAELGIATQKDGTLLVSNTKLSDALSNDFSGVISLFTGENGGNGVSQLFSDYLDSVTDSTDGFLAARKESTNSTIRRIDLQISNLQARLDSRQKTLEAQFSAMENLVSSLNSQSTFLSQQLSSMPSYS